MRGRKTRIPDPVSAEIVKAWGGIPVSLPAGDVLRHLVQLAGVHHQHPGTLSTVTLIMNSTAWNGLSADDKKLVEDLTAEGLSVKAAKVFKSDGGKGPATLRSANIELIAWSRDRCRSSERP